MQRALADPRWTDWRRAHLDRSNRPAPSAPPAATSVANESGLNASAAPFVPAGAQGWTAEELLDSNTPCEEKTESSSTHVEVMGVLLPRNLPTDTFELEIAYLTAQELASSLFRILKAPKGVMTQELASRLKAQKELKDEVKKQKTFQAECGVCMDAEQDTMLYPCGHLQCHDARRS